MPPTIQELLEQFGSMNAADHPADMFDQLNAGVTGLTDSSNAEVDRLTVELAARDQTIKDLQAHNYTLMRAAAPADDGSGDKGADGPDPDIIEDEGDGDEPATLEDELFTEKKEG